MLITLKDCTHDHKMQDCTIQQNFQEGIRLIIAITKLILGAIRRIPQRMVIGVNSTISMRLPLDEL